MPALVITLLGPDRPGLVGAVADVVKQHEGNWLESRMSHLAGQFAGVVLVDVADAHAEALVGALGSLDRHGLKIVVERDSITTAPDSAGSTLILLHLMGNDRPGIVREVSQVLAERNVNVEEFSTECSAAPMSGGQIFRAEARLRLPDSTTVNQLQHDFERITTDLMVDITLEPDE